MSRASDGNAAATLLSTKTAKRCRRSGSRRSSTSLNTGLARAKTCSVKYTGYSNRTANDCRCGDVCSSDLSGRLLITALKDGLSKWIGGNRRPALPAGRGRGRRGDFGRRLDPRRLPAQHGVALEELALVDRLRLEPVRLGELAALAVGRDRVAVAGRLDMLGGDPALEHQARGLRHRERVRHTPVGAGVDEDALAAVLAHDLDHALVAHLGVRIKRERGPEAAVEHVAHGLLVVVVDHDALRLHAHLEGDLHAADRARLLVAVRRVHHHQHVELERERELRAVVLVLDRGLVVVADLADRDYAFLGEVARQQIDHAFSQRGVVGLLAVQPDRAVVADAELRRAKALPADQAREVVDEAADVGPRLALPERRFDHRDDAGGLHPFVVVGGTRRHVDVRIDETHDRLRSIHSKSATDAQAVPRAATASRSAAWRPSSCRASGVGALRSASTAAARSGG